MFSAIMYKLVEKLCGAIMLTAQSLATICILWYIFVWPRFTYKRSLGGDL